MTNAYGVPSLLLDGRNNPEYQKRWIEAHPDYNKDWKRKHKDSLQEPKREWYRGNREKEITRAREWQATHAERVLENARRTYGKRTRGLPTKVILGVHFLKSHLHHLTPSVAVYIPSSLNRSIYHNIWTGQGMTEINVKAMEFYERGGPQ